MDRAVLKDCVECALGRTVEDERLDLLACVAAVYEDERVLVDGNALPLWRDCVCADACRARFPKEWQPGRDPSDVGDGAVALPWIGAGYRSGGLLVLGINC
jgi:hypothetical protein